MKRLVLLTALFCFGLTQALQTAPTPAASPQQNTGTNESVSEGPELTPLVNLASPEKYGMAFLSFEPNKEALGFMITPKGKIGVVPLSKLTEAAKAGYRPLTVSDLMTILSGAAEEEANLQKRFKELADDYNGLAARYNRLAAVSAATPVQTRQAVDERQMMRLMVFQSLLQRALPGPPLQIQMHMQTVDCTKSPLLCGR